MAALDLVIEVLQDPHHARRLGGRPVGGDRHEVELEGQSDGPGDVGHEHERALEDPDQQEVPAAVVAGDLLAQLLDLALDVVG